MNSSFPNTSPLEAVRMVLAIVGIVVSIWAIVHATDGSLAFASPIRKRMVSRRRIQMAGYLAIFLVLGGQTAMAATTPEPPTTSFAGLAVSYAEIAVMVVLLNLTLMFSIGWAGTQEIVKIPLDPTLEERVAELELAGRQLGHLASSSLQPVVLLLGTISKDTSMPENIRREADIVCAGILSSMVQIRRLHSSIRSLGAIDKPDTEEEY
jgi:hypothetical protein